MLQLKSRQSFIPNGFVFYLPEVKWRSPRMASFDRIVTELTAVIQANPFLAQKHKWPTDREGIANWVDLYNATVCARMGWDNFIMSGEGADALPKSSASLQSLKSLSAAAAKAKELISGAKSLMEWDDSGEDAVSRDLSTARAAVCVECPKNDKGDWTQWFTVPAAELIKRRIAKAQARNLSTIHDEKLQLCSACACPLRLKVHVPMKWIALRLTDTQKARLAEAPRCWVIQETNNP